MAKFLWNGMLDDRQLRLMHCSADVHCDFQQFKQLPTENTHGQPEESAVTKETKP